MKIHLSLLHKHYQWAAVCTIYQTLRSKGYQAFLAGGCVRDALLAMPPKDLDIATDAPPEVVESLFEKTVDVGKSFGVIRVLLGRADVEVATFRTDGDYKDGRHPEKVVFTTPAEDALRRDFTINALFLDPGVEAILDFVTGQADLQAGLIRAVGDAEKRFQEDHLRILRAIRFSGQLGFEIESETFAAICKMASLVKKVSSERLFEEMSKLLGTNFRGLALANLRDSGLMDILFPFRMNDISFLAIPTHKNWKLWALFFLPLHKMPDGIEQLKEYLANLKFSNKDKKSITDCFVALKSADSFFQESFGKKILKYSEESVRWACEILSFSGSVHQKPIEDLHLNWLYLGEKLPAPFLGGHDVSIHFSGAEIGARLQELYTLQIEGKITSREEALNQLHLNASSGK